MHTLLEEILPQNTVFNDYEVHHDFERIGPRTILLNARRLDHVQFILLAMEDITARKQAETQLQQHQAQLERQVQERTAALRREMAERQRLEREAQRVQHFALLGRLAAGVSHEIRNPLGAIFLHVDLLEEELRQPSPESAAEIAQALTEIKTHLARLDDLVQDYLSLVRVGAIQQAPEDLGRLVTQLCAGDDPGTRRARHHAPAGGPGPARHGGAPCAYLPAGAAESGAQRDGRHAAGRDPDAPGATAGRDGALDVGDTGIGIPPEQTTQIFEPLHTTKPGGTGLGLYIVQEVVAAHGGQVAVQSTVGAGHHLYDHAAPDGTRGNDLGPQRTACPLGGCFTDFAPLDEAAVAAVSGLSGLPSVIVLSSVS